MGSAGRPFKRGVLLAEKLDRHHVAEQMQTLPHWTLQGDQIERALTFPGFPAAIDFVNRIAAIAEELRHHPDIRIQYNRVHLALSTHDAGGLTARDFELARRIETAVQG